MIFENVFSSFKDNVKKMDFQKFDMNYNKICLHQFLENYNPLVQGSYIEIGSQFVRNAFFYPEKWEINDFLLTIRSLPSQYSEPKILPNDPDGKDDFLIDKNFAKKMSVEKETKKISFADYEWKFVLFSSDYKDLIYDRVEKYLKRPLSEYDEDEEIDLDR